MFSSRTGWRRVPNRLAGLVAAARATGGTLLDLTETNPTRAGLRAPADILQALGDPAALAYDPAPFGLPAAREAVARDYRRRGIPVEPDRVLLTASTSEAYAYAFKLLCDPGDDVLVPRPSYPLFEYLAALESVEVRAYPLHYDGQWHLSADAILEAASPRTRAVVVVSPNNPTGSFVKREEAEALRSQCGAHGLALVSDEVFADYAFADDPRRCLSLFADGAALTLCLGGISKSCGLPQLKLGWMAIAGPPDARDEARGRLEVVSDTYLSVGTPVQVSAARLLARRSELQAPIADRVRSNLGVLRSLVTDPCPATLLSVEGGWSAVIQVPATRSEDDWVALLLERDRVLAHPGYFYDFPGEAFLVVSLLTEPGAFRDGASRLVERVSREAM
jgi:hypothetical protein